jgi:cytochrome c553
MESLRLPAIKPIPMTKAVVFFTFMLVIISCSHYDDIMKNGKESTYSSKSHNAGQNCMNCHNGSEYSEAVREGGWWHVAGTVVGGSGKDIELWTEPNRKGELVYKLQIEPSGNFYTSKIVDFKTGVYPVVVKKDGSFKEMSTSITMGACNSCHGATTDVIKSY